MELFEPRTLRGGGGHYDPELMIDMMRGHAEGLQEGGGGGSSVNYCSQRNLISQFEGTPASLRNCIYSVTSSTQHHQQQQQQQQYQQQQQKQQKQQKQQEVGELEEDNEDDDGVGVGEVSFHSIGGKRSSLCNWGGIMQDKVAGSEQRLSGSYSGSTRKQRSSSAPPRCRVEGCRVDLLRAKEYHRRHKVCDDHAKSPLVVVNGMDQRFCQQCSRFHLVTEFDDAKRSCRRRLASHNERRRKSTQESMALMASLGSERRSFDLIMDRSCFLPEGNTGDQVNNNWNRFPGDVMMHYPPSMKLDPLLSIAHFPNWSSGSGGGSSTSLDASNGGHHYWGGFSTNEAGLVPDASDVEEPLRLLQSTRGSSLISAPFPLLGQAELPSNCSSSTSRRALSLLSPHSPFSTPNIAPLAATSTSSSTSTSTTTTTTASTAAASFARDFNLNQSYPMINYLTSSAPPSNQLERQLAMSDVVADAGQQRDYNRLLPITMSGFASIPHDF